MQTTDTPSDSAVEITAEMKEESRLARRFFSQIDRMSTLLSSYPDGHPVVMQSVANAYDALYEFFELSDRLTVQVDPHSMLLPGSDLVVWETAEPRDFCFMLSRDGVFLIHLLAGITRAELRRFISILNQLLNPVDLSIDAVTLMFEGNFSYIAYEALDESLAALAGIDADIRDRDTADEREMIEEMFNDAFKDAETMQDKAMGAGSMDEHFQLRMQMRHERQRKLEVGSRQFLSLSQQSQTHLIDLKRGFTQHRELEHREGEILSALLGARPKPQLQRECITQIGEVMGGLVETDEPWEALSFLKIIHTWRDRFAPQTSDDLKSVVRDCFTQVRLSGLLKLVAAGDKSQRRAILKMFDALRLNKATMSIATVLGWELDPQARTDIMAYIRKQAGLDLDILAEVLANAPDDQVGSILEILLTKMPQSRPMLVDYLRNPRDTASQLRVLEGLQGTWKDAAEIRELLVPLLDAPEAPLQLEAMRSFCESAPQHVARVMSAHIDTRLQKRPEDEVREIVGLFATHGGPEATKHLKSLIRRRGVVSAGEQELAVTIARALVRTPRPHVIELLESVSGDWLVPKRIRGTCQEVADLLKL
ncbi:hypothetical protein [Bradymonas sediminis]|uniref:Uncharacterized protein n=1 Tax=Bradymonas sediminis TaxID=1548548 RepID=A0A2Z4FH18_9DELT|nr:hypothetical protein [Bradymonas sediminis]AWV88301.1 hypothetical protein DN745_02670 [Bradymonas sediminis]TDP77425.1 hypothetical protein DFR33_101327 [Bradymonas sediminis]